VQPAGPGGDEAVGELDRVREAIGHAGEIALFQADRSSSEQVDRRDDQHAGMISTLTMQRAQRVLSSC